MMITIYAQVLISFSIHEQVLPALSLTLRLRQNGHYLPDEIFKYIFLNKNVRISINISLKFVVKGTINNITALVQIKLVGTKPLFEPMMIRLKLHICVTQPQ